MSRRWKHANCCEFGIQRLGWGTRPNSSKCLQNSSQRYKRKLWVLLSKWGRDIGCLNLKLIRLRWKRWSARFMRRYPWTWSWKARKGCESRLCSSWLPSRCSSNPSPHSPKYLHYTTWLFTAPSNSTPNSLASWRTGLLASASAKIMRLRLASMNVIKSLGSMGVLKSKQRGLVVANLTLGSWSHHNDIIIEEFIIVFDRRSRVDWLKDQMVAVILKAIEKDGVGVNSGPVVQEDQSLGSFLFRDQTCAWAIEKEEQGCHIRYTASHHCFHIYFYY